MHAGIDLRTNVMQAENTNKEKNEGGQKEIYQQYNSWTNYDNWNRLLLKGALDACERSEVDEGSLLYGGNRRQLFD